jgi:hypothetical protein
MVGRAEVLTPAFEQRLGTAFAKAKLSDTAAREEALAAFKKLGRFAGPALQLATKNVDAKTSQLAWQLFQDSQFPASAKPPSASPYE